jgi:predicted phage terminase large subunit-like protein
MLDPSKGADAGHGDYSAYVIMGWAENDDICYVEADMARRSTPQMVADGVELVKQFRPDAFGIESNQSQYLLEHHFLAEFNNQNILGAHISPLENDVNKVVRIRRLGAMLARGCIRFKANSPGTKLLVEQLKEFPVGDHDDGPDALEMAVRLSGAMLEKREREGRW